MSAPRGTPITDAMLCPVQGRDVVTGESIDVVHADDCRALERDRDALILALEGILAQTAKHSRVWGQAQSAAAFARDPDTAIAFGNARALLARIEKEK